MREDGARSTRRDFLRATTRQAGGVTLGATLPVLAAAVPGCADPPRRARDEWPAIAKLSDVPRDSYIARPHTVASPTGKPLRISVYLRRRNPAIDRANFDDGAPVIAISSLCTHLGCPVRYIAAAARFICPCHGGIFDREGLRLSGPSPRGLDRFYVELRDERVRVGPRFSIPNQ